MAGHGPLSQVVSTAATATVQVASQVAGTVQAVIGNGGPPASQAAQGPPGNSGVPGQAGNRSAAGAQGGMTPASGQGMSVPFAPAQAQGIPGPAQPAIAGNPGLPHTAAPGYAARGDAAVPGQPASPHSLAQGQAPRGHAVAPGQGAPPPQTFAGQPPPSAQPAAQPQAGALPASHQAAATAPGMPGARADGALVADRGAMSTAASLPSNPATPQTAPPATAAFASLASAPGNSQASSTTAVPFAQQAVPASQAAGEARGNTVMPGVDRGAQRVDGGPAQGHTVELGQQRTRRSLMGAAMFSSLGRNHDSESSIQQQANYVFQWLYWALTITAWLCLGLLAVNVIPAFTPAAGSSSSGAIPLGLAVIFGGVGLGAGVGAWLMSRRMSRLH